MSSKWTLWFWRGVWGAGVLAALGLSLLYLWLPVDGATGDLESFSSQGFRVQWVIESRPGGLQVGDVIVRAGGYTLDEWLSGAPRGPEWRNGGVVRYKVQRNGQLVELDISLAPIPFGATHQRWFAQLLTAQLFFIVGTFVFWKKPDELAARLLMLFCLAVRLL